MSSITEKQLAAMLGNKPNYRRFLLELNAVATEPELIVNVRIALDSLRVERRYQRELARLPRSTDGMLDSRGINIEALDQSHSSTGASIAK